MATTQKQSVVLSNNDVIYIWWRTPRKIKNCLGFSIHRVINGVEESKGLQATVGFGVDLDKRKSPQTTDEWPIQSFNWKDLYAPHNKDIVYRIYPMIGTWDNLTPDKANKIETKPVRRTQGYGDMKVIFNRGILSTQAFAKSGKPGKTVTQAEAKEFITNPSSIWRKRLGGQMLYNVKAFFDRAKNGGKYYAALYELTDAVLIKDLTRNKKTEIILSNANSSKTVKVDGKDKTVSIDDGTNADTRKALHKIKNIKVYDRMLGSHIGHNKFVIYEDASGKPQAVLTGSTNWTPTGLCGQTNNMVIIDSPKVAAKYKEYWDELKKDIPQKQGEVLRTWCVNNSCENKFNKNKAAITLWYSPNTKQKSKPPKNAKTPADMQFVFDLISKAQHSVLYLVFNPGSPSIIDAIKAAAEKRKKDGKPPLFVRGAISDAKIAKAVTTNIVSSDILKNPDTYHFDRVTGVAALPGPFSYFEGELLKLGFSTIHDKLLVIDPFSTNCTVITGSHNLGYAASYKNDENMLIIQKDKTIAQAYATHVLDIVNHFKWRYKLQDKIVKAGAKTKAAKEKVLKKTWNDLNEYDLWMNYYFNNNGFVEREKFLF